VLVVEELGVEGDIGDNARDDVGVDWSVEFDIDVKHLLCMRKFVGFVDVDVNCVTFPVSENLDVVLCHTLLRCLTLPRLSQENDLSVLLG
jgi:hypothetical protein